MGGGHKNEGGGQKWGGHTKIGGGHRNGGDTKEMGGGTEMGGDAKIWGGNTEMGGDTKMRSSYPTPHRFGAAHSEFGVPLSHPPRFEAPPFRI